MGATEAVIAPRGSLGVQSFEAHAEPIRFRLPPSDIGDLRYVFTQLHSDAGMKSPDPRAGELSNPKLTCEQCGTTFRPMSTRIKWHTVKGQRDEGGGASPAIGQGGNDGKVFSVARFCDGGCRAAHAAELAAAREKWRSPDAPPVGSPTRNIIIGDGRVVRVYAAMGARRVDDGPGPDEVDCLPVSPSHGGNATDLLDLERYVDEGRQSAQHARGWKSVAALQAMASSGDGRCVRVLRRLYGPVDPNARFHLWGKGAGMDNFAPREIATVAPLTVTVLGLHVAPGDGEHAALDIGVAQFAPGPRRGGETKRDHLARELEADCARRTFLLQVGREAEALIAEASTVYRTARRAL